MARTRRAHLIASIGVVAALALVATLVVLRLRHDLSAFGSFVHEGASAIAAQAGRIDTLVVPAGSVVLVGDSVFGAVTAVWQVRSDSSRAARPSPFLVRTLVDAFSNAQPFVVILAQGRHDSTLVVDDRMVAVVDSPMDLARPLRVRLVLSAFTPSGPVAGYLMTVPPRVIPVIMRRPGA